MMKILIEAEKVNKVKMVFHNIKGEVLGLLPGAEKLKFEEADMRYSQYLAELGFDFKEDTLDLYGPTSMKNWAKSNNIHIVLTHHTQLQYVQPKRYKGFFY